jgi:putative FmdB family regulatory protein
MPLFDFRCRACGHEFEGLVRGSAKVSCPACNSVDLEQLLSHFAVSSETTRQTSFAAARRRLKNSKDRVDKQVAEREEIEHHLRDH